VQSSSSHYLHVAEDIEISCDENIKAWTVTLKFGENDFTMFFHNREQWRKLVDTMEMFERSQKEG